METITRVRKILPEEITVWYLLCVMLAHNISCEIDIAYYKSLLSPGWEPEASGSLHTATHWDAAEWKESPLHDQVENSQIPTHASLSRQAVMLNSAQGLGLLSATNVPGLPGSGLPGSGLPGSSCLELDLSADKKTSTGSLVLQQQQQEVSAQGGKSVMHVSAGQWLQRNVVPQSQVRILRMDTLIHSHGSGGNYEEQDKIKRARTGTGAGAGACMGSPAEVKVRKVM